MIEPKKPPHQALPNEGDPGFPPLRDITDVEDLTDGDADDLDADHHEDGGGD